MFGNTVTLTNRTLRTIEFNGNFSWNQSGKLQSDSLKTPLCSGRL